MQKPYRIYIYNIQSMDIEKLLKALDKDENEEIIDMTTEKIDQNNISVIQELELEPKEEKKIISKL